MWTMLTMCRMQGELFITLRCMAFINHFTSVYTTTSYLIGIDDILQGFHKNIPMAINDVLDKPYIAEKVKYALFQMDNLESHGLDGLSV